MAIRGELFTNQVNLDNRSYYFNVKENRNGDIFLQIVESKIKDGEDDRRAIVVFADDMQKFLSGMDESLKFVDKEKKERAKLRAEKKAAKEAKFAKGGEKDSKPVAKRYSEEKVKVVLLQKRRQKKEFMLCQKDRLLPMNINIIPTLI